MKIINLFKADRDHFKSIEDLPLYNWQKINATNDFTWLLKNKREVKDRQAIELAKAWDVIICEFIDVVGLPPYMQKVLFLKRDIHVLRAKMYLTGNKSIQTFIQIKLQALEELTGDDKADNLIDTIGVIYQHLGIRVVLRETTVAEYYSYLKALKNKFNENKNKDKKAS